MSTSAPFSLPFWNEDRIRIYRYVEIDGQPKEASWLYKRAGPTVTFPLNLSNTAPEIDVVIRELQFSDAVSSLWQTSTLVGYGKDACVRLEGDSVFPIIKLAHPKNECRQRLRDEFEMMRRLSHLSFVAKISPEPLMDAEGIFGFRLELLDQVEKEETTMRKEEIKIILVELHQVGYCHGDVQFRNVMKRKNGDLVLIDFAYAGALGEPVPDHVPRYMHPSRVYRVEADLGRIQGFI
jgi:hypothetical protein